MLNKAKNGGTNGRAKIGYINTTVSIDGHKVNTVAVDEDRGKYVTMAFELFATGNYLNAAQLRDKLTDLGLRMPGSNAPISDQTVHSMLRDRYYIGYVVYKGMEYPGRHEPLVTEEVFQRVQRVLDSHSGSGARNRTHHHYLKGTVFCGKCRQRFILQRTKGQAGSIYYYFFCGGRQDKTCRQPYISVELMEKAVEAHYGRGVQLPESFLAEVRSTVDAAVGDSYSLTDEMRESFTRRLSKLDKKENYFLDLASEEDWSKDKLREKVQALRAERKNIQTQLQQTESQLETGRQVFYRALDLLANPQAIYCAAGETARSVLNKTFFTRLYVDDAPNLKVTEHELCEPFDVLSQAYSIYLAGQCPEASSQALSGSQTEEAAVPEGYQRL